MACPEAGEEFSTGLNLTMAAARFQTYCWAMNTPVGDERSSRQMRNDVNDLYDMVGDISSTVDGHTLTLAEHTVTLDEHTVTLAEHTEKLDHIIGLLETH